MLQLGDRPPSSRCILLVPAVRTSRLDIPRTATQLGDFFYNQNLHVLSRQDDHLIIRVISLLLTSTRTTRCTRASVRLVGARVTIIPPFKTASLQ